MTFDFQRAEVKKIAHIQEGKLEHDLRTLLGFPVGGAGAESNKPIIAGSLGRGHPQIKSCFFLGKCLKMWGCVEVILFP